MLNLVLTLFIAGMLLLGLRHPFVWVLVYVYIDNLNPQKISWGFLADVPVSLITFILAFGGWLLLDDKKGTRFSVRQLIMLLLLFYCGYTTMGADYPEASLEKWAWVWKALLFAIFLPLTLRTPLRIEATALYMVLSAGAIVISAGMKTVFSGGGGYGNLQSFINDNNGLYEGSTMSMVAIAIIPLILWLSRHGTIFPPDWRVKIFAWALCLACMLVPVGTQTRTGLICIGLLGGLMLRHMKRRFLYLGLAVALGISAYPFLPQAYRDRMSTIGNHTADQSASTRVAVWEWTWDYVKDKPMGGGFNAYLGNKLDMELIKEVTHNGTTTITKEKVFDKSRAYHSAYFEMLGEQGWPGLIMWLLLQGLGLLQLELLWRRMKRSDHPDAERRAELAIALQQGHVVYLFGALFVGIAFQPFVFMLIGLQIALVQQCARDQEKVIKVADRRLAHRLKPLTNS